MAKFKVIKNALAVYSHKKAVDVLIKDNIISKIQGPGSKYPDDYEIIDVSNCVVLPGLVNTHHHLFQMLTRAVPGGQDEELFKWLLFHYEVWKKIDEEGFYYSAKAGLMSLLLSGVTYSSDHLYLFPEGMTNLIDVEIKAAQELGIRFHPTRGSMSRSKKDGGLPPDNTVQTEEKIIEDSERLISKYHDHSFGSMLQIALAPCSPFSISEELMKETLALGRKHKLMMHTHLAETKDEHDYCLKVYGKTPLEMCEDIGWLGEDIWFAHGIHFSKDEIKKLGKTKTGITHCPQSNMRLASGIASVNELKKAGARVGLGVDGSASNDNSNMLLETRSALLLQRLKYGANAFSVNDAIDLATSGGASLLGRKDLGQIKEGMLADLAIFKMDTLEFAGAVVHDPIAALIIAGSGSRAYKVMVNGKLLVDDYKIIGIDESEVTEKLNNLAKRLV